MSIETRLQRLERKQTAGDHYPDHFIHYTYGYGGDETAAKDAAEAKYRATHHVKPDDKVGFIALRIVSPDDPHEWIWGDGAAVHTCVPRAIDGGARR
jgi:hypothetical protein